MSGIIRIIEPIRKDKSADNNKDKKISKFNSPLGH
jgi:hypothetical protein